MKTRTFIYQYSLLVILSASPLLSCAAPQSKDNESRPLHIAMPDNPEADARARRAFETRTVILANKIELYLPPALYGEISVAPATHVQTEFDTTFGRRISIKPPEGGVAIVNPARVEVGKWRLASHGPIEIFFIVEKDSAAARLRATGVTVFARDGQEHKNLGRVDVDDDRYTLRQK